MNALLFALAIAFPAAAQTQDGSITGSIRDAQVASVPGAEVAVQGADATHHVTTERDGVFRFERRVEGHSPPGRRLAIRRL